MGYYSAIMRRLHIRISHSHDLCWGAYSCFELLEVCMCESIVNYSKMQSCCFRLCISDTFYGRENKPFKKKKKAGIGQDFQCWLFLMCPSKLQKWCLLSAILTVCSRDYAFSVFSSCASGEAPMLSSHH